MLSESIFIGLEADEWTAIGTILLAIGAAFTAAYVRREHSATKARDRKQEEAENRRRTTEGQNRLADALERAAFLRVEKPNLNGSNRIAIWTDGPHSFLAVRVTWRSFSPPRDASVTDSFMPDGFNLNPGAARSSLELPADWAWPPLYEITYSDVSGYRYRTDQSGEIKIVRAPDEIKIHGT